MVYNGCRKYENNTQKVFSRPGFRIVPNEKVIYNTEYDALHNNQSMTIVERCLKAGNNNLMALLEKNGIKPE